MDLWQSPSEQEAYGKEAKANMVKAWSASKRDGVHGLVGSALVMAVGVAGLHYMNAPDALMISATIALATLCLIAVVNMRAAALEADVIYVSGAIEWFGNRLLNKSSLDDRT
jgi:hypothetical protein